MAIQKAGFKQSWYTSLFIWLRENSFIAVLLYVDDMIIIENDFSAITNVKRLLNQQFRIKDLKIIIIIIMARSLEGISISQRRYILDVLDETGLLGATKPETFTIRW